MHFSGTVNPLTYITLPDQGVLPAGTYRIGVAWEDGDLNRALSICGHQVKEDEDQTIILTEDTPLEIALNAKYLSDVDYEIDCVPSIVRINDFWGLRHSKDNWTFSYV